MIDLLFSLDYLMYTKVLFLLSIVCSVWFIKVHTMRKVNYFYLTAWMCCCCPFAWLEFSSLNIIDIVPVWMFSKEQILGIFFLSMPIEDIFFPIMFNILTFLVYNLLDERINHKSNEFVKVLVFITLFLVTMFFFNFGSYFARYQCIRMVIGMVGIWLTWDKWDLKHFTIVISLVFVIAFGWDLLANLAKYQHWFYRYIETPEGLKAYSKAYADWDWWWFKIGKAWFTIEICPWYYLSGGVFTYGLLNLLRDKFPKISQNLFIAVKQIKERQF